MKVKSPKDELNRKINCKWSWIYDRYVNDNGAGKWISGSCKKAV